MRSAVEDRLQKMLLEESGRPNLNLETTLEELFAGNDAGLANAIVRGHIIEGIDIFDRDGVVLRKIFRAMTVDLFVHDLCAYRRGTPTGSSASQ